MAIHGTILARELSARGGANDACTGTSWNSARRFSANATRVIRCQNSAGTPYGAAGVVTLIEATGPLMPSFSLLRETTHCVGRRSASGPA